MITKSFFSYRENRLLSAHGCKGLLTFCVLSFAWLIGFSTRLFSVIRFESIIHEFDPWFNYRATKYMVENGFYNFLNWFDERAWYPLGRIVGGTVYPGLMLTSGAIHYVLNLLNFPIHIREICVFLAPVFSGLTAISTYLLTKEVWNEGAGLFAGCFIAIVPGYISRSVAGSYDNEGIAIFALMMTYYLWIKGVKTGSIFWSVLCSLSYFYMVSAWGGYVFIINLIPLHVFVLLCMQRYSERVYVSYTTFYILGLICSMQVPFVGFQPVRTSEHMAAAGVFVLLQAVAALNYLQSKVPAKNVKRILFFFGVLFAALVFFAVVILTQAGIIAPWCGRFYSLWDTSYAKIHIPIISSVSENQPTTWTSFFLDFHILVAYFPAGIYYLVSDQSEGKLFVFLYALFASYFAGVMIRLILVLAPIVCICSGIVFSELVTSFSTIKNDLHNALDDVSRDKKKENLKDSHDKALQNNSNKAATDKMSEESREHTGDGFQKLFFLFISVSLGLFMLHSSWVSLNAYSINSLIFKTSSEIIDDYREAYFWINQNTNENVKVLSWWDYGYQLAGFSNRTTITDNNTWNNTQIAIVGLLFSSNEKEAYKIAKSFDVDYILINFGGVLGFSGDDLNKFPWILRIAQAEYPSRVSLNDFMDENENFVFGDNAPKALRESLMYKLSYYKLEEFQRYTEEGMGFDKARHIYVRTRNIKLRYFEEAYATKNCLVRIYKTKKLPNNVKLNKFKNIRQMNPYKRSYRNVPSILE